MIDFDNLAPMSDMEFVPNTPEEVSPMWVERLLKGIISPVPVNLRVLKVKFSPATRPGDNFGSYIVRFDILLVQNGRGQQLEMIGKFLPKSKEMREMLTEGGIFRREAEAYINWAGAMLKLHTKSGAKIPPPLPRIFCGAIGERGSIILLEDLKTTGFRMVDKFTGLTEKEALLCLDSLAKLHALSYAVQASSPESTEDRFPNLVHLHMDESTESQKRTNALVGCVAELLRATEGEEAALACFKAYAEKHDFSKRMASLAEEKDPHLRIILHGDCWTNNIMFRFKKPNPGGKEEPVEAKFVDLQAPRYAHPAVDIAYFLFTSVPGPLRHEKNKDFLRHYYNRFFHYLEDLDVTDITRSTYQFEEFWDDYRHYAELAFLNSCFVMPFIFGRQAEVLDVQQDFALDDVVEMRRKQMRNCPGTDLARWTLDLIHDAVDLEIL